MARPKKASSPRRPATAGKEVVHNAPSARAVTGGGSAPLQVVSPVPRPDPEVLERAARRRFSAQYKLGVLRQADACAGTGELGALLRREGLYSSHLTTWRRRWARRPRVGRSAWAAPRCIGGAGRAPRPSRGPGPRAGSVTPSVPSSLTHSTSPASWISHPPKCTPPSWTRAAISARGGRC